jgi:hypothetical protein
MALRIPSVLSSALPLTLLVSPLLLGAAQPSAQPSNGQRTGVVCNLDGQVVITYGGDGAGENSAIAQPVSNQNAAAEQAPSIFSVEGLAAALRLLRANPYANGSAEGLESTPSAMTPDLECLASTTLVSAMPVKALPAADLPPEPGYKLAQLVGEIPDLSGSPTPAAPTPAAPTPTTPAANPPAASPSAADDSSAEPAAEPAAAPVEPPASSDEPSMEPPATAAPASPAPASPTSDSLPEAPATPAAPVAPVAPIAPAVPAPAPTLSPNSALPPDSDPGNYTPANPDPTPFDGSVVLTLATLPDGNYRYVAGAAEQRTYTEAELQQRGTALFVFRKEGTTVTGRLWPNPSTPAASYCVTGTVSENSLSGAAYGATATEKETAPSEPVAIAALQLSPSAQTESGDLYYATAVLDLSGFSMINVGPILPPASCGAVTAAVPGQ